MQAAQHSFARKFLTLTVPSIPVNQKFYTPLLIALIIAVGFALAWLPLKTAILLVGGTLFLALVLLYPTLVLYALIPAIPYSSLVALPISGVKAGAMEMLLLLGLTAWLLKILTRQAVSQPPLKIHTGPLLWPFLLLIGAVTLSWLNSLSIRAALFETIKWVEMFLLYLFIINLLPAKQIKWVVLVILSTGIAQAILGIYQFYYKVGPEGFLLFGGRFLRAYGTFAQPNPYAGYLGLILPLALSVAIWAFSKGPGSVSILFSISTLWDRILKFAYWLCRGIIFSLPLLIMLAALYASQSRGAMLGFAAAAVAVIMVRNKKTALLFAGLFLVAAFIWIVGSFNFSFAQSDTGSISKIYTAVTQRVVNAGVSLFTITDVATTPVTDANFATVERVAHWQAAINMWRDNPWLGVGFGNYAVIYPAYAIGRWLDPLGHAHNYALNLGAEVGLTGMVAYIIFWIWVFAVSFLAVRRSNGFYKAVAAGAVGVFVHLQIHNMVDNLYVQGMYLHVGIIMGVIAVICLAKKGSGVRN